MGRAIVALMARRRQQPTDVTSRRSPLHLVRLHRDHFVIVVDRTRLPSIPGIAMVPVSETGALLAFQGTGALFELELALVDALDDHRVGGSRKRALTAAREQVRAWRRDSRLSVEVRHLVVVRRVREVRQ
jgi:hypothetical protein